MEQHFSIPDMVKDLNKNAVITNPDKKYVEGRQVSPKLFALKHTEGKWVVFRVSEESGKLWHPTNFPFTYNGRKLHRK